MGPTISACMLWASTWRICCLAMLIAPLAAVAYPAFSVLQNEPHDVGRSLVKLQGLAAAILFPACFGLAALAVPTVSLLYGHMGWVGLDAGSVGDHARSQQFWSLNADAYRAVGRPDTWAKVATLGISHSAPLLFWGAASTTDFS